MQYRSKHLLVVTLLVLGAVSLACGGAPTGPSEDGIGPAEPLVVEGAPTPGYAIVLAGDTVHLSDSEQQANTDAWTEHDPPAGFPGDPTHYTVHQMEGDGDCAMDALQFEVDGAIHTRLFFLSACFGDTSEETVSPLVLEGETFALRSDQSYIVNAEMAADGTWNGTAGHRVADRVYRWSDAEGLVFVDEIVRELVE